MSLLLFIIAFLLPIINAVVPRVTGGGCIIVEDELYYLGGFVSMPNVGVSEINKEMYKLNLRKGFKVSGNTVEWEEYSTTNPPRVVHGPYIFYFGNKTLVTFQAVSATTLSFEYFDIEKKEWYNESIIEELYELDGKPDISIETGVDGYTYHFYILQDESNLNRFYISGYLNRELPSMGIRSYDIQSKQMKLLYGVKKGYYIHQLFVKNNKVYFLEYPKENVNHNGFIDVIHELDLTNNQVKKYSVKLRDGFYIYVLKTDHSTHLVIRDFKPEPSVYEVQFEPLNFKELNQTSSVNYNGCCLTIYNNLLINSFGFNILGDKDENKLQSTNEIRVINTTDWKQLEGLPSLENEQNNNNILSKSSHDGKVLIGCIVVEICGVIIIVIIIVFKLYKRKLKKEEPPSLIVEPIIIEPDDPFDTKITYCDSEIFTYCQEIDNGDTMLPKKLKFDYEEYKV
ncbi:hypothetical protein K502DRAFT_366416 [Neoconidiobolus thromboides FSU 785]|nr:hypothetical protein K502DRAFT_366416 [Neoconidiobolus thromboides FSU 785]